MPESTHEIASRVVEDAGGFDNTESVESAPVESTGDESTPVAADTGAAPASTQPRSGDSDELLSELGLKPREDGREHRIPQSRVKEMRAKWETKARETAAAEWQVKVAEASRQAAEIEQGLHEAVMRQPEQFLRELVTVNPQIAQFLAFEQRKQEAAQMTAGGGEMPQPDVQLQDGSRTYSLKGLQALLEWNTGQVESRLAERYKPVEQTVEQFRETQRRQAAYQQSEQRVSVLYADAKQWPGFAEHETEIAAAFNGEFKDLPTVDALNAAYRKVVVSKLIAGKNQTRQEVIKDLQGRPKSTALTGGAGAATETPRERSTSTIARDVLKRLNAAQKQ